MVARLCLRVQFADCAHTGACRDILFEHKVKITVVTKLAGIIVWPKSPCLVSVSIIFKLRAREYSWVCYPIFESEGHLTSILLD